MRVLAEANVAHSSDRALLGRRAGSLLHELSIMGYQSPAIEWIICLFMFLAGANFALQYRALLGRPGILLGVRSSGHPPGSYSP